MAKKTVYPSERGDDKNDGLTEQAPVLTGDRAIKISIKYGAQLFDVRGSDSYITRMNAELEKKKY